MNFVFLFPDEMRAESLSCYGHPLTRMPHLDQLASEGTVFEQCHVQHTVCSPSRCSLMTGLYPHVNGHRTLWHLLRNHEPSLFRYLKEDGYQIQWFGKNDLYDKESLPHVADVYKALPGEYHGDPLYDEDEPGFYSFLTGPVKGNREVTSDWKHIQEAVTFLKDHKSGDKPFMLYLPITMPHAPYSAPEPYYSMYHNDDIPDLRPVPEEGKPLAYDYIRNYRDIEKWNENEFKKLNAVYLGMNSFVDDMLGELLATLKETGLEDDTVIIVSSDHGDWAGDYGLVEKWPNAFDDTLTRVPLIIKVPGMKKGHRVKEQVELFDIMPTIMDLAKVTPKHTHFAQSLIPQLLGEAGDPNRYVFAEGGYGKHEPHCFEGYSERYVEKVNPKGIYQPKLRQQQKHPDSVCRSTMIRSLDYKLVKRNRDISELYDLNEDPRELRNLYYNTAYENIRRNLEDKLLTWYIETSDIVPIKEDYRGF